MEDCPENVQGFKVMRLKFKEESKSYHHILWKRHNVRVYDELKPPGRTLFVVNVPPYCTESNFKHIFMKYGKVDNIYFQKKPSLDSTAPPKHPHFSLVNPVEGFKVAYVVFTKPDGLSHAMSASPSNDLILSTTANPVATGIKKWHQEYNSLYVSPEQLSTEIKSVMESYEKEKEEVEKAAKEDEPDEDGWITVNSKKTVKPKLLKENEFKKKTKRKKKKQAELVKFYAFQQRQSKIDKLAQLRKRFEEDKKRINMMKSTRKFKP
ncbi:ribosomal RNA-processing protein 7 homolog A-like [Palaemon carinicauda]|uniref:ribosomal RNA-processing protein 7 homolog A-like n=1 Tax=Palaemon carinicauda TaxID=392227 RepID=UPI0035B69282